MRQTLRNVEHCSGPEGKKRRGPIERCTHEVSKQRATPRVSALWLSSLMCGCWICVSTSDLTCSRQQARRGPPRYRGVARTAAYSSVLLVQPVSVVRRLTRPHEAGRRPFERGAESKRNRTRSLQIAGSTVAASTVSLPSALSTPISWPRPPQWARRVAMLSTTSGDQRGLGTAPPRQPDVEEQGLHHATTGDGALLRRVASPEYSRR
ncbi:hypothetical protein EJ07DRAFT_151584 [Lizonia empirigonia]|nr:hypothetical protein EJ07DRAFT_151584 [Lizonia empirigonia]